MNDPNDPIGSGPVKPPDPAAAPAVPQLHSEELDRLMRWCAKKDADQFLEEGTTFRELVPEVTPALEWAQRVQNSAALAAKYGITDAASFARILKAGRVSER